MCVYVTAINKESHEFEKEKGGAYGGFRVRKREGRNDIIVFL